MDKLEIEVGMRCIIQLGKNITITAICTSIEKREKKEIYFADIENEFNNSLQFHLDDWTDIGVFKQQINKSIMAFIEK